MKTYVVKLAVPSSRMGDVLGMLERDIADVTIAIRPDAHGQQQINGQQPKLLPPPADNRPGLTKLILEAIAKEPQTRKTLRELVTANGYKDSSLNTALQKLKNDRKVKLVRTGGQYGLWHLLKIGSK